MDQILYIEPTGEGLVAYQGYVEVNLKIPGVSVLNEDVLMLVVNDSSYSERVPIALGTIHVDRVLQLIKDWELKKMSETWQRSKLVMVLVAKAAILAENEKEFTLDQVKGDLKITKVLTLASFEMANVLTQSKVKNHRKRVNAITEPPEQTYAPDVVTNPGYAYLKPGSSRVSVSLRNLIGRKITIKPKTVVAKLAAANVIPLKLAPKVGKETENTDQETIDRTPLPEEKMKELFKKLDFSGTDKWEVAEKKEMKALIREYTFLFALDDLELGKTSIVKHKIKLVDNEPFKE